MDSIKLAEICSKVYKADERYKQQEATKRVYTLLGLLLEEDKEGRVIKDKKVIADALYHIYLNLSIVYVDKQECLKRFIVLNMLVNGEVLDIPLICAIIEKGSGESIGAADVQGMLFKLEEDLAENPKGIKYRELWDKYLKLQVEYADMKAALNIANNHWQSYEQRLEVETKQFEELQGNYTALQEKYQGFEAERQQLQDLQCDYTALQEKYQSLEGEKQCLAERIGALQQEKEQLKATIKHLTDSLSILMQKNEQLKAEAEVAKQDKERVQSFVDDSREDSTDVSKELKDFKNWLASDEEEEVINSEDTAEESVIKEGTETKSAKAESVETAESTEPKKTKKRGRNEPWIEMGISRSKYYRLRKLGELNK